MKHCVLNYERNNIIAVFRGYLEFYMIGVGSKHRHLLPIVETLRVIDNGVRIESVLFWIINVMVCMKRLRLTSLKLIVFK